MPTKPEPRYVLTEAPFYKSQCGSLIHRLVVSGPTPVAQAILPWTRPVYENPFHSARNFNRPFACKTGVQETHKAGRKARAQVGDSGAEPLQTLTERGGFEPPNEVNPRYAISSRARSTAPAPLQEPRLA